MTLVGPAVEGLVVGLNAVILAAEACELKVLVTQSPAGNEFALPFGPFDPQAHRTLEIGLRAWVREQTGFELGYVEQLYTFGDLGREAPLAALTGSVGARVMSIGYLGLAPEIRATEGHGARWIDWWRFFPWEDHRNGRPSMLSEAIEPALHRWADTAATAGSVEGRHDRVRATFGLDGASWYEERALDRYELLYEAGLVAEAGRDLGHPETATVARGDVMASDHRRILATALSRLRGKIKYRPIVFELMPDRFTLSMLRKVVESIVGFPLHEQNFRRALDRTGFVEGTGQHVSHTGGRPAELYRYRPTTQAESAMGLAVPRLKDA